jgi:antitoxin component HigA of HigAB toxin-antitoxin module
MTIKNEHEFRDYRESLEIIISKGTKLGSMELLSDEDKSEYVQLSRAVIEYESVYHPLPGKVSLLLTDTIRKRMEEIGVNQKQAAKLLGISESRVSDLLNGHRKLNMNIAKRLRDNFGIPADFILDFA